MSQDVLFHKLYRHPTSSEWVVFVHGAGGSSSVWFKQIRAYREHFNIVLLDLRGHGRSNNMLKRLVTQPYTFNTVTKDILHLLDHLKIERAHFVGISMGTIIIRVLAEMAPDRVETMIMGGAVTRLTTRSQVLVNIGNFLKNVVPYMWLYSLFAFIVMPQKSQKESRNLFIGEARKLCTEEFKRWFRLTAEVNPIMKYFREREIGIPTLYLMGGNDFMFIQPVREMVARHRNSYLTLFENCGHVCNVERPDEFNEHSISFIYQRKPLARQAA